MELRDFQVNGVERVIQAWETHRCVIMTKPTGAGKTVTARALTQRVLAQPKTRVLWLVQRNHLVDNADRVFPDIHHGFIKAGYPEAPHERLQIGSVQTYVKRRQAHGDFTHMIVDECHNREFLDVVKTTVAKVCGLTATPMQAGGKPMAAPWSNLIRTVTYHELVDRGILVKHRTWVVDVPELREFKESVSTGEIPEEKQAVVYCRDKLVGSVGSMWERVSRGKSALVFCVNRQHATMVMEDLQKRGARCVLITAETPRVERQKHEVDLASGVVDVIVCISIYKEGLDIPSLRTVIIARAATSLAFWVQACNRGSRAFPGKTHFNLIDHSGALFLHGSPMLDRDYVLDDGVERPKRPKDEDGITIVTCRVCQFVRTSDVLECPECMSVEKPVVRRFSKNGDLVELTDDEMAHIKPYDPEEISKEEMHLKRRRLYVEAERAGVPHAAKTAWVERKLHAPMPEVRRTGLITINKNGVRFSVPADHRDVM